MPVKIQIENRQSKFTVDRRKIRSTISKVFKMLECEDKEISIFLTDDENIKKLNRQYLGRNKTTNVLSFSMREGEYGAVNPRVLGDVVISLDTADRDARRGGLSLRQEVDFLLIHGILHLLGYNHENTSRAEADEMERKEKELFGRINYRNKISI